MRTTLVLALIALIPASAASAQADAGNPPDQTSPAQTAPAQPPPTQADRDLGECGGRAIEDWRRVQPSPERDRCLAELNARRGRAATSPNRDVELGARGVPQTLVPEPSIPANPNR